MKRAFVTAALFFLSANSWALEEMTGRVTYIEPTYAPALIQFTIDSGSASCPAGRYIKWNKGDLNNNKAVYAALLLAIASGKRVRVYVNDGDATCYGQFLHLLPD